MIAVEWVGLVPYGEMLERQRLRREAVLEGAATEVLWMLEHPPVVTLGRRGGDVGEAQAHGVEVVQTERGGLATWHGPGQLVGYPIIHAARRGWSVKGVVEGIERGLVDWLATRGVEAHRREGCPGVWVTEDKIASLGLHFRRGVSMHGFSLNLSLGDGAFAGINPCGLSCRQVSVEALTNQPISAQDVALDVGMCVLRAVAAVHA